MPNKSILHTWYWICSGVNQLCQPVSWLECHWASRNYHQHLWSDGTKRYSQRGKPGSTDGKTSHPRIWISQRCMHPTEFPGQSEPLTWFCRWANPPIGIITWALQVWTWSANIHALTIAIPFLLLHLSKFIRGLSPTDFPAITVGQDQNMGFYKVTPNAGQVAVPLGSFPTGGTRGSGENSTYAGYTGLRGEAM